MEKAGEFLQQPVTVFNYRKGGIRMELTLSDEKAKELMTEVLVEMIREKRGLFREIVSEVLEDAALGNAIAEGRKDNFVSEDNILEILGD